MINVIELTPAFEAEYRSFLLRDPRSLIYSTLEFRDLLQHTVGGDPRYFLAIDERQQILGALPVFRLMVPGVGGVINSLPWYGSHGSCVIAPDSPVGIREELIKKFDSLAASPEILTSTMILLPYEEKERVIYESLFQHTTTDGRIGQITPLPEIGADTHLRLEAVLRQKTRNLARKSLKQGFTLVRDSSDKAWNFLYKVHQENMQAVGGRAKPQSHFDALRNTLPPEWQQISMAMLDGVPVAALLLLYFNKTVEYFTPVIKQEYRSLQPLSFLIWHGMLDAIGKDFRWWNWGGTWASQHSLHHFKAGWGAVDSPYSYYTHASKRGLEMLQLDCDYIAKMFPFYYVYPFNQLMK